MGNRFSSFLAQRRGAALVGIAAAVALTTDLIVISPAIVSFAITVTLAVMWCVWLDRRQVR